MIVQGARWLRLWLGPIWVAIVLAVVSAGGLYVLGRWYEEFSDMYQGVFVEAVGAVMDIIVFGIIIALFVFIRERRREVSRQMELIDDFKKWNSEEARHRIAGAIKRLNRLGRTAIDFTGIEISHFSFRRHGITRIVGSTFFDGVWYTIGDRDHVKLEDVDFADVNCQNVIFSRGNPFYKIGRAFALFKDCRFVNAQLCGALFRGAHIEWSAKPPEEMGEWEDMGDGTRSFIQTYMPPFMGANLKGTSFEKASFKNADFRDAKNIMHCEFRGARGLDRCMFDDDEVRTYVLASVRHESQ